MVNKETQTTTQEPKISNLQVSKRRLLKTAGRAIAGALGLEIASSMPLGETTAIEKGLNLIASTDLSRKVNLMPYLTKIRSLNLQIARADCIQELGSPVCLEDACGPWIARYSLIGAHYEDLNGNNHFDPNQGERFVSTVKDHRFMEIRPWGCDISATDPRVKDPTSRRMIAYQDGNGIAQDIETKLTHVDVQVKSVDFVEGLDKNTGQQGLIAVHRAQLRWYSNDFGKILDTWEICAYPCPIGVEPTLAKYYVATPKTRQQLAELGLTYRPDSMAQPTGNPRPAIRTAQLH